MFSLWTTLQIKNHIHLQLKVIDELVSPFAIHYHNILPMVNDDRRRLTTSKILNNLSYVVFSLKHV